MNLTFYNQAPPPIPPKQNNKAFTPKTWIHAQFPLIPMTHGLVLHYFQTYSSWSNHAVKKECVCVRAHARACVRMRMLGHFSCVWLFVTGSSVQEILQVRILEWVAMPSSRDSSQPRDQTHISYGSCTAGRFFTTEPLGKAQKLGNCVKQKNEYVTRKKYWAVLSNR